MIRLRCLNLLGLFALVPLMLSITTAAQARTLQLPICGAGGAVREIHVPLGGGEPSGRDDQCCPKGCHAGCSRKRVSGAAEMSR